MPPVNALEAHVTLAILSAPVHEPVHGTSAQSGKALFCSLPIVAGFSFLALSLEPGGPRAFGSMRP